MRTVGQWLEQLGLAQYAEVFERNAVDLKIAKDLTQEDLRDLGVEPLGHRKILLRAIAELNGDQTIAPQVQGTQGQLPSERSLSAEAERRQLTVLFCDLVGSTALAQKLDPEELRDLMQTYQRACGEVIARYEGHIAQYLGDGLMVYFGWPTAHEDDAARGIRAGLEAVETVSKLTASVPLSARVGIHTGLVVVGQTGKGDASVPSAAVGETPNIAARLQALAEAGSVVVSERTRSLAGGLFDYADLGAHVLKGMSESMPLFRALRPRTTESRFEAAHGGVPLTPLVGREEEGALLLRRWQQARDGRGQVVLIGGEPGIGKSRLTQVLREQTTQLPHLNLRYQCSPYHLNSPLDPIIEHLERAAGFTREDTPETKLDKMEALLVGGTEQITETAPLIAALLSLPTGRYPPLTLSPQKQKEKTLEALIGQVEALSQRQPLLMVFEDVHWMDPTSQELLDAFVPRLQRLPILLVITYRPEYTARWGEQAHVTPLVLNRLGRSQGAELVANLTGGKPLPQEVADQILAQTDGVPLFIEELTKSLLESKLLREAVDRYTLEVPLPALGVPTTLRDSLIARLDRLAPVRDVAQIGACIGREFSYELLAALAPVKGRQLEDALEQLTEAGLLFKRGTLPGAFYTFKHALVQDAAHDSLLRSKRAQLHAQIAKVLEADFSDQVVNAPELLAHHYTQAGNLTAAIPLWRKAGGLALSRVALQEAVGDFQKALALIEQQPPSAERDGLELSIRGPLNFAWVGLRGWPAAQVAANASAILKLAENLSTPQGMLTGLYGMWSNVLTQGRVAESLGWAERLLEEGKQTGDSDLQIFGHWTATMSHQLQGHLLEAREHNDQILPLYNPQRAPRWMQLTGRDLKSVAGTWSSHRTWLLGYPDQAVKMSEETIAHARRLGHAFDLGMALTLGAWVFDFRCEPERLLERVSEADRLAREQSIPILYQIICPMYEGWGRLHGGMVSESISLLRPTVRAWESFGGYLFMPHVKSALAKALALQGDLDAALHLIDDSLEQIERPGWQERWCLAEVLRLKGWILRRQGRGEEAEAQLRASIDCARQQRAKSWELRSSTTFAELLAERGKREAARDLLAPIYTWFTEGFDTHDLKAARAMLEQLS